MIKNLYFLLGLSLPLPFAKILGNFSFFDLIIGVLFIADWNVISRNVYARNLKYLYKFAFVSFLVAILLGFWKAISIASHFTYILQYYYCVFVALPVFIVSFRQSSIRSVVSGIILGACIALFFVILIYANSLPDFINNLFNTQKTARIRVGLTGVNDYAILLVSALLYLSYNHEKGVTSRVIGPLIILILVVATGSRVGIILALSLILIKFVFRSKKFSFYALTIGVLAYMLIEPQKNPFFRLVKNGFSDGQRSDMVVRALDIANENPLGIGLGTHFDEISGYPVHNFFVINLVEQGLIAGTVFLMPIVLIFIVSIYSSIKSGYSVLIFLHFAGFAVITHAFDRFFWAIPAFGLYLLVKNTETNAKNI